MRTLVQGDVILADVDDPQGGNRKVRPLLVISSGQREGVPCVIAVAITGRFDPDALAADEVVLPHGAPPARPLSQLTKPCVAKATWIRVVPIADVVDVKGRILSHRVAKVIERMPRTS